MGMSKTTFSVNTLVSSKLRQSFHSAFSPSIVNPLHSGGPYPSVDCKKTLQRNPNG